MPKTLTCKPELLSRDLTGKVYVVTGANSGVGLATTEQLAKQGATVVAACRRVSAGEEATRGMAGDIQVRELDLGSLASVRSFVDTFKQERDRLDGLVNNAGVMAPPEGKTVDGFETQLGVNHLGHFLLTELLLDVLKASAPSRVVCVSSAFHVDSRGRKGDIHLDDLNYERRDYDAWDAYGQAKLANVLHARELARRVGDDGVTVVSVHPGWVRSNLVKHALPPWVQNVVMKPFSGLLGMISPEEGAHTTLHCLLDDDVPAHNGEYYSQKGVYPKASDKAGGWPMRSPNPKAHDDQLARALYDKSRELVGLGA